MNPITLARLNDLGNQLEALYLPLKLDEYLAPLNRQAEKERLFMAHAHGQVYQPQFTYHPTPDGLDAPLQAFLKLLRPQDNAWEALIYEDVMQSLQSVEMAQTHDPSLITTYTCHWYGIPTQTLVFDARQELIHLQEEVDKRTLSAEEIAKHMQVALEKAGLTDWQVVVYAPMNARMSVRGVDKQIKIRQGDLFTPNEMKRLLVHEVGTHVFRSANGDAQPLRLLRFGLVNYLVTEEGLATFHEDRHQLRNSTDQRRYALRVIAADLCLRQGFYEVFCQIAQYTTLDEAFDIVARAKRGFVDTGLAGSHVKDKVYFEGFHAVSRHLQAHPHDYPRLMSGKVSLAMLPMLEALHEQGYLIPPKYLPEMLVA